MSLELVPQVSLLDSVHPSELYWQLDLPAGRGWKESGDGRDPV